MAAKITPMLQQYLEIKKEHADCILFFRLGDFYEMFFEDAVIASRELEIVLTSRESGADRIPMCGVPFHAVSGYLAKLLNKGFKVAICEQVEDPKLVKGLVKREVVRVITPGTVIEEQLLKEKVNNFLAVIASQGQFWGLAYVDLSTGEFKITQIEKNDPATILSELSRIKPAELYLSATDHQTLEQHFQMVDAPITIGDSADLDHEKAYRILTEHFALANLCGFGCEEAPAAQKAAATLLQYLQNTQKNALTHIRKIATYQHQDFMVLDPATRRNLELTKTTRSGEAYGSLLWVLDQTVTASGGRMLRTWLEQPLTRLASIRSRQDAIAEFTLNLETRATIREYLNKTYDLQRIISKLAANSANARDLLALCRTLEQVPLIKEFLAPSTAGRLVELAGTLEPLPALCENLRSALRDDPPLSIKEGGMIKASFDDQLGQLLEASSNGKSLVAQLEQAERERTGIKSLKVGFNQVFGYYIEVTNANLGQIPADYIRKQTLANGERFINQTLKEYEDLILNAHDKSIALEYQIFLELRQEVLQAIDPLHLISQSLAELDVLISLAEVAVRYNYTRPELNENGKILILESRHPVVERMLAAGEFVPNDILLDQTENRTLIITGPNMAGKSTYMRQAALIVLLAHIGSFVPAKNAEIALVDRIFTRVGAADDLATGQSTFMVEMNEVSYILNHATPKSLIILDELGRGTSTFDGLSIAWAVIEFVNNLNRLGAKTLMATHYHELTKLEHDLDGVKNYHVAVERDGEAIVFIRKIIPGSSNRSYGIEVARLAGLPVEITDRAKEILNSLETSELTELTTAPTHAQVAATQLPLFPLEVDLVLQELKSTDLAETTPLQALNLLFSWQKKLRQVS